MKRNEFKDFQTLYQRRKDKWELNENQVLRMQGRCFFDEVRKYSGRSLSEWEVLLKENRKEFTKSAIKIWQEVERYL